MAEQLARGAQLLRIFPCLTDVNSGASTLSPCIGNIHIVDDTHSRTKAGDERIAMRLKWPAAGIAKSQRRKHGNPRFGASNHHDRHVPDARSKSRFSL